MNETNHKPQLDERFVCNLQGKDFVQYPGLLDLAHQFGLKSLEVEIKQTPTKENGMTAICVAQATTQDGKTFTDLGDADPSNVNKKISVHILRMASTRAKARVLRDLTNVGMTALEELGEVEDAPRGSSKQKSPDAGRTQGPSTAKPTGQPSAQTRPATGGAISEPQKKALYDLAARQGMDLEALEALSQKECGKPIAELNTEQGAALIRAMQHLPKEGDAKIDPLFQKFHQAIRLLLPAINKIMAERQSPERFDESNFAEFEGAMIRLIGGVNESKIKSIESKRDAVVEAFVSMILTGEVPAK